MKTTTKTKAPEIFPIYLREGWSKRLVNEHARSEFADATRYHYNAEYTYAAKVMENGEVELSVSYHSDNGFCISCGNCLRKTVKPFSPDELANIKTQRMFALAEEEYERREQEKRKRAILDVQHELFGA
jgi:hypothetical protein